MVIAEYSHSVMQPGNSQWICSVLSPWHFEQNRQVVKLMGVPNPAEESDVM